MSQCHPEPRPFSMKFSFVFACAALLGAVAVYTDAAVYSLNAGVALQSVGNMDWTNESLWIGGFAPTNNSSTLRLTAFARATFRFRQNLPVPLSLRELSPQVFFSV